MRNIVYCFLDCTASVCTVGRVGGNDSDYD